jgi:hypothetical protein
MVPKPMTTEELVKVMHMQGRTHEEIIAILKQLEE